MICTCQCKIIASFQRSTFYDITAQICMLSRFLNVFHKLSNYADSENL